MFKSTLTLLCCDDRSNAARRTMRTRVRRHTSAGIIVAVGGHGKGQSLKVGTDLLWEVHAKVGSVSVSLSLCVRKQPAAKVCVDLCILKLHNDESSLKNENRAKGQIRKTVYNIKTFITNNYISNSLLKEVFGCLNHT